METHLRVLFNWNLRDSLLCFYIVSILIFMGCMHYSRGNLCEKPSENHSWVIYRLEYRSEKVR